MKGMKGALKDLYELKNALNHMSDCINNLIDGIENDSISKVKISFNEIREIRKKPKIGAL